MTDLRDRLADAELELATLEAELNAFRADYMREVGVVMARVQELEARILALVAERSNTARDREAAAHAEEEVQKTMAQMRAIPPPSKPPTDELKKLFREAAKQVHPDRFSSDPAAHAHAEAFMKRLNAAYRAGHAGAIADLMRQWAASPLGAGTDPAALRMAITAAEERLRRARESQIAAIMEEVMAAAATGRDRLAEMRRDAHNALADAQARLADVESAA